MAYFLINKVGGEIQAQMSNICISKLKEVDISVHSMTCDGTMANKETFTHLGCKISDGIKNFLPSQRN